MSPETRVLIKNNFTAFCMYMVPKIGLGKKKLDYQPFHFVITDKLQEYLHKEIGKLILTMPQQHGKTLFIALFIVFYLGHFPDNSIIYATHSADRAEEFMSNYVYKFLFSAKYRALFPIIKDKYDLDQRENTSANKRKRKRTVLTNSQFKIPDYEGTIKVLSTGQGIGGKPGNVLIVDDYFGDYIQASSEIQRKNVENWWRSDLKGRAQANSLFITTSTRYHSEDPIGLELRDAENNLDPDYIYPEVINFPAQKELHHADTLYDTRKVGEYLWPELAYKYADGKKNEVIWSCVYQQEPVNEKGLILKAEDILFWENYPGDDEVYISIDTCLKDTVGDKTSIQVWQHNRPNKYLIDIFYIKTDLVALIHKVLEVVAMYPRYLAIIVENRANGQGLIDFLRNEHNLHGIVEADPSSTKWLKSDNLSTTMGTSKADRLQYCLPAFHAHEVFLCKPTYRHEVIEVKRQLINFTGKRGKSDDHVDALTMALNYIRTTSVIVPEKISGAVEINRSNFINENFFSDGFIDNMMNNFDEHYNQSLYAN